MIVLAGLPPATHGRTVDVIRQSQPSASVIGAPSPVSDGSLYSPALLRTLLGGLTGFALRRRTNGPPTPLAPKSITLLYVPAPDDERLLRTLDFAVMPQPLTALAVRDVGGRLLRHSVEAAEAAIEDILGHRSRAKADLEVVNERINRLNDREALLLPPRNFVTDQGRLSRKFVEMRRGRRSWSDRFNDLGSEQLTRNQIARIPEEKTRQAYVDSRRVAFLTAHPTAYDGLVRELEESAALEARLSVLRSLYRFGIALPSGFHHDAQPADGSRFNDFEFDCDTEGRVCVNASHANIYSNDFVRAKRKQKI